MNTLNWYLHEVEAGLSGMVHFHLGIETAVMTNQEFMTATTSQVEIKLSVRYSNVVS